MHYYKWNMTGYTPLVPDKLEKQTVMLANHGLAEFGHKLAFGCSANWSSSLSEMCTLSKVVALCVIILAESADACMH